MKSVVLGAAGQDGAILCKLLAAAGHEVISVVRPSSRAQQPATWHIDCTDSVALTWMLESARPDCIYNMADQDHVGHSRVNPHLSLASTVGIPTTLLEYARRYKVRILQPISATVFGKPDYACTENSELNPASPYACAKAYAWMLCKHYRQAFNVDVRCPILYNHDSARREPKYVLHEIVQQLYKGNTVTLMDPDECVDIGYAPRFCEAMVRMMARGTPQDYVIATGDSRSLRHWARLIARFMNMLEPTALKDESRTMLSPSGHMRADITKAFLHGILDTHLCMIGQLIEELVEKYALPNG